MGMSDNQHAIDNAKAWFESIREMVAATEGLDSDSEDEGPRDRILESPLSVQVRSGWYSPGDPKADTKPAEYEILLSTGGPALRIVGELSEYGDPTSAVLQWQDWGTPWTDAMPDLPGDASEADEVLLSYASHFYFGE